MNYPTREDYIQFIDGLAGNALAYMEGIFSGSDFKMYSHVYSRLWHLAKDLKDNVDQVEDKLTMKDVEDSFK